MAIRRDQVIATITNLTPEQVGDAKELEALIDHHLRNTGVDDGGFAVVKLANAPCLAVRSEITRRYRQVGWEVRFGNSRKPFVVLH